MFWAGGIAIVAVVAMPDYDDHSRHRDHYNHSQYSDGQLKADIARAQRDYERLDREVDDLAQTIRDEYNAGMAELSRDSEFGKLVYADAADPGTPKNAVNGVARAEKKVQESLRDRLANDVKEDKQKIAEIDKLITRINEMELSSDGK